MENNTYTVTVHQQGAEESVFTIEASEVRIPNGHDRIYFYREGLIVGSFPAIITSYALEE